MPCVCMYACMIDNEQVTPNAYPRDRMGVGPEEG